MSEFCHKEMIDVLPMSRSWIISEPLVGPFALRENSEILIVAAGQKGGAVSDNRRYWAMRSRYMPCSSPQISEVRYVSVRARGACWSAA